jgi:hypothetical protein
LAPAMAMGMYCTQVSVMYRKGKGKGEDSRDA